jgi:hypothetical protein
MRTILCALALLLSLPAFAEKWALLIGINDYEDRNYIASLGAADNDARKLKEVLKSKMGFPDANIELLVSDGDNKPTRSNIILALGKLAENAKAGDTVFVFFSGHGTEINGVTYLLPHDFKGRNKFTGTETALEVAKFKSLLGEVKAKALIMAWDMCRNDPFAKGKSGDAARSKMGDPKAWNIAREKADRSADAPVVVNLFACSTGESSFEWGEKNRGYFAWFLEEGMKGAAADTNGNITLGNLAKFVRAKVMAQTKASEPAVQSPTSEMAGASPEEFVLLGTNKPNNDTSDNSAEPALSTLKFMGMPGGAKITIANNVLQGTVWRIAMKKPSRNVLVMVSASGYRSRQLNILLEKGQTKTVDATLEKEESRPTPPQPGNTTALTALMEKIRQAHHWDTLSKRPPFVAGGTLTGSLSSTEAASAGSFRYNLLQHPDGRFRASIVNMADTARTPTETGFDGETFWKTVGRQRTETKPNKRFYENPIGPLLYALANPPEFNDKLSRLNSTSSLPYLQGRNSDRFFGQMRIVFAPKTCIVSRVTLRIGGEVFHFNYNNYTYRDGIPIPNDITVDRHSLTPEGYTGPKLGELTYTLKIGPNMQRNDSVFQAPPG